MKISCRKKIALHSRKEAILVPVYKNIRSLRLLTGKRIDDEISRIISSDYFNFEEKEIKSFYLELNKKLKKIYLIHVPKELDEYRVYMELGAKFARLIRTDKIYSFTMVSFEDIYGEKKDFRHTKSFVEGLKFGLYDFDAYRTKKDNYELEEIEIVTGYTKLKKFMDDSAESVNTLFENVGLARDLVNTPPSDLTPAIFADRMTELASEHMQVEVMDESAIREAGLNLIDAVGRGSANPPRLVKLNYTGDADTEEHIALVGKGVTFDSGGTNLKPTGSIEDMKTDMAGAATVFAATRYAAMTGMKVNIRAYLPLVENIIGGSAYKPGDVVTSAMGKTIEIGNTDAEGRLILADCLYLATQTDPELVIDIATLTGAVVMALGSHCAGLFSNRRFLAKNISDLSFDLGEDIWELPLFDDYQKRLKSPIADLSNIGSPRREAGSIIAALFLREFVDNYPWIHLDIAGTAHLETDHPVFGKHATGFGVRLIAEFIQQHYAKVSA